MDWDPLSRAGGEWRIFSSSSSATPPTRTGSTAAAFVVGSEIIARSLDYGREWMLKAPSTEYGESMAREEQAYVFENPHERQLRRIFEIARVEYGRIDYAMKDGRIETWEINLNPTLFGNRPRKSSLPPEIQAIRRKTNDHFYQLFERAWEAVDAGGENLPPVPIRYSRESLQARIARIKKQSRWKRALRKRLRPLRPAVMSIGRALSPILVALARRAGSPGGRASDLQIRSGNDRK